MKRATVPNRVRIASALTIVAALGATAISSLGRDPDTELSYAALLLWLLPLLTVHTEYWTGRIALSRRLNFHAGVSPLPALLLVGVFYRTELGQFEAATTALLIGLGFLAAAWVDRRILYLDPTSLAIGCASSAAAIVAALLSSEGFHLTALPLWFFYGTATSTAMYTWVVGNYAPDLRSELIA